MNRQTDRLMDRQMDGSICSVERTTLQLIHKEIVHKKITDLILFI